MNWESVNEQVGYDAKSKIKEILDSEYFINSLYIDANGAPLSEDKRTALGQFYTPGEICANMIDKLDCDTLADKTIEDPTCGSGNLLIACLIAGADISRLYGNEYDAEVIPTCRNRIREAFKALKGRYPTEGEFREWQIHQGNAMISDCLTEFGPDYDETILKNLLKRRYGMKGGWMDNPGKYVAKGQLHQVDLFEDFFAD